MYEGSEDSSQAHGTVALDETTLAPGDGAAVSEERSVTPVARGAAEVLLFDLA